MIRSYKLKRQARVLDRKQLLYLLGRLNMNRLGLVVYPTPMLLSALLLFPWVGDRLIEGRTPRRA